MAVSPMTTPPADPPLRSSDEVLLAFWTLIQATGQRLKPMIETRLGLPFRLLIMLVHIRRGAVHPGQLTRRMDLTPSAVTRGLDELERRGLIQRGLDPGDSRRIQLALTGEGQATLQAVQRTAMDLWQLGLEDVSDEEVALLMGLVRRIAAALERLPQPEGSPED